MFRSIRWRIALAYVGIIVFATLLLSAYLLHFVRDFHLRNLESQLIAEARLVANIGERAFSTPELDALAKRLGAQTAARVTIIDRGGAVLGDSHENPAAMENHRSRPEVRQALASGVGESSRHSTTVGYDMMYVAVPIKVGDDVVGVARVALAITQVDESLGHIARSIAIGAGATAFLAILVAMYLARATTRPVRELTQMAVDMASGDLDRRIRIDTPLELGELAKAFNQMAEKLQATMSAISEEHGKMTAILANMADGIIITDVDGKVTSMNSAAATILQTSGEKALGRTFVEIVRDHDLAQLLNECRQKTHPEPSIRLVQLGASRRYVRAVATGVRESPTEGRTAQYLVVLQDLTEIRRSESVRREFIANVSHELRTPLATMKALVETLQDGAIDDQAAAKDFLLKMEVEVDEMTQLVRELLELSRIESGQVDFRMEETDIALLVRQTAERMRPQSERAGLELEIDVEDGLPPVSADGERIEQVLVNLIHNAIKFTPPQGKLAVSASSQAGAVVVSIADTGVGISAVDIPRIFERFYKTDKSRSSGGTGLGLAIAKHIVQAHGGRIWVQSEEDRGSTFRFLLPGKGSNPESQIHR